MLYHQGAAGMVNPLHSMLGGMFGHGFGHPMHTMSFPAFGTPGVPMVGESYSYSRRTGADGRPVVREHHRRAVADGLGHTQENYELHDEASQLYETGIARGIGGRSVTERRVSRGTDDEVHRTLQGVEERGLEEFDREWQRGVGDHPSFAPTVRSALIPRPPTPGGPPVPAPTERPDERPEDQREDVTHDSRDRQPTADGEC